MERETITTRILHIIPTFDRGGAEKQLTLLAAGLTRDQFDVHVSALTRGGPMMKSLQVHGIPTTVIGKSWKFDPLAYWKLKRHIQRLAPDIVHTWIFAANSYGRHAALSAGLKHVIAGERSVDPWKAAHELMIDRWLARKTSRIVVPSPGVRDFYAARRLPTEKFTIIPNGVAPQDQNTPLTREDLLDQLDLPAGARLVGAVGRLWPQKRYKDAIWAADLLKVIRDDVHLLIVGDGPQRWRLERYRDQVQIRDRVHFLGQRDDVPRMIPHFDCLWLTSGYEGMPNSILEAMAASVPVVATDIPGNRDLVVHGETGYLAPVGHRAGFASWTNQLLDDPETARRLGEAGRRRALEHFTVEKMVQRHVQMYRRVMEEGRSRKA